MQTINAIITAALNAAKSYAEAIEAARNHPECKGKDADALRPVLLPIVAGYYAVPVKEGEGKAKGRKVLDKEAPKYEACNKALQRLIADIVGKTSAKDEVEIPAEVLAAAAKLVKLANEYEGARSLAARALAAAFAK